MELLVAQRIYVTAFGTVPMSEKELRESGAKFSSLRGKPLNNEARLLDAMLTEFTELEWLGK